jgi:hypothetical protein
MQERLACLPTYLPVYLVAGVCMCSMAELVQSYFHVYGYLFIPLPERQPGPRPAPRSTRGTFVMMIPTDDTDD